MDRETFEQLVNQWLDQPERADLRERIDLAVATRADLRVLLDEWIRLDRLIRGANLAPAAVDWIRLRREIDLRTAPQSADDELERRLRLSTEITDRVDWDRLRVRIADAVRATKVEPRAPRGVRRLVTAFALLSAAAAVILLLSVPQAPPSSPRGFARVTVTGPALAQPHASSDAEPSRVAMGVARVAVSVNMDEPAGAAHSYETTRKAVPSDVSEVFLMVEPIQVAVNTPGSLTPFQLN